MPDVGSDARAGPAPVVHMLPEAGRTEVDEAPALDGPAYVVVHARLREQAAELVRRESEVREDAPDGVHQMRVALRRLRSALVTFRPLLDRTFTEPVRAELAWIAGVLGEARDAEVMRERLATALAAEPAQLVVGPVAARVDDHLSGRYRDAQSRAVEAMDSERYRSVRHDLERLVADPPWTLQARRPARTVLPKRMRSDWKRLQRRVASAAQSPDAAERNERLHEARKAAKRARYTAETLEPVFGRDARRLVNAGKRVQSTLGDHQDCVVTQAVLRRFAAQAYERDENTFTYGLLHAREESRAVVAEREFDTAWRKASRKKLHRWHG